MSEYNRDYNPTRFFDLLRKNLEEANDDKLNYKTLLDIYHHLFSFLYKLMRKTIMDYNIKEKNISIYITGLIRFRTKRNKNNNYIRSRLNAYDKHYKNSKNI